MKVKVAQSCLTLHGIFQARILEGSLFPSPGDLPNLGIKPRSPALQVDSLPSEPPGKPSFITTATEFALINSSFCQENNYKGLISCPPQVFYTVSSNSESGSVFFSSTFQHTATPLAPGIIIVIIVSKHY